MKVHDRGTKKWTSLMLPEHVEQLREVFAEYKEKPFLDEQKRTEIDQKLKFALAFSITIELTYYEKGDFHTLQGELQKIDHQKKYIIFLREEDTRVLLHDVIDVEIL